MRPQTKAATYRVALAFIALGIGWTLGLNNWKRVAVFVVGLGAFYYCAGREAEILTEDRYADVKAYLKKEGYI